MDRSNTGPSSKPQSLKSKHSRSRSGVPLEETPILQGWLARESGVVEKLLNKRYAALYSSTFMTYRKDTDPSPSKVWPLTKDVTLTPVEGGAYNLRHKNTSTLWAVARGAYDTMEMWAFTVTWPMGQFAGPEKLTLAFDTKEKAEEWHQAISAAVSRLDAGGSLRRSSSDKSVASSVDYQEARSAEPGAAQAPGGAERKAPAAQGMQAGRSRLATVQAAETAARLEEEEARKGRAWASVLHINGVAVYTEETDESGEGGAVMVSAVVRAPPADVFRNLVQMRKTEGLGVFAGARLVEAYDANNQVVAQSWRAAGFLAGLCAPREMVLLRTWRKDEDGTYIVLYQSTRHRSVREPSGRGWFNPVRVQVQAAGFTIAPLMPQYAKEGGESQEALVTMVLKADLGGYLSEGSLVRRLLGPASHAGVYGLLEPVVTSIIILRDTVEQDRFVVRPLSALAGGEQWVDDAEEAAKQRGALKKRTATMLAYRRTMPLLKAQQETAEKALESAVAARQSLAPKAGAPPPAPEAAAVAEADVQERETEAEAIRGTCDTRYWSSPGDAGFKVRGPTYLTDRKKVPAAMPMCELVAADLLELEEPLYNIARYLPSIKHSPAPFLLCVQLMVPSTPPISLTASFATPFNPVGASAEQLIKEWEEEAGEECPPSIAAGIRSLVEFLEGDGPEADKRRNKKFKLIPNIAKGSWIIRQSVGTTPVILGQKLTTKYFRGPNYFEVDVDIGSSSVAANVTNLVCGATKSLTVDLGVLVEGQEAQHLPEQLLGTIRLDHLDLGSAGYLDEVSGKVIRGQDLRAAGK